MTENARPKLVKFKPVRDVAHDECRRLLKGAAKRTKGRGGMAATAYVVVHPDGSVGSAYYVSGDHGFTLLGAIANLPHRVQTEVIEE